MKTAFTKFLKPACMSAAVVAGLAFPAEKANAVAEVNWLYGSYMNPAMMDLLTKTFEVNAGGTTLNPKFTYKGTQAGRGPGKSSSDRWSFVPNFNIMYRVQPAWVIGFDVSSSTFDDMSYKTGPATGTKAILRGNVYNWKISYQAFDNFTLGFGINVMHLRRAHYSFYLGAIGAGGAGQFQTKTSGAKAGWNAGFLWKIMPATFINGSVWSRLNGWSRGHAIQTNPANGAILGTNQIKVSASQPDIFSLNVVQFFSKEWLVSLTGRYMLWRAARKNFTFVDLPNIGTTPFSLKYKNSWVANVFTKYHFHPEWAVIADVNYDSNPQPLSHRPVIFPVNTSWYTALGVQYMPTPNWELTFLPAFAWSNAKINHAPEFAVGKSKVRVFLFDVNLAYKF